MSNYCHQEELQPGRVFIPHLRTATNNKENLGVISSYILLLIYLFITVFNTQDLRVCYIIFVTCAENEE
jgi:hypothetical protein